MIKIKLNLFESIIGAIFLPNIGIFLTTTLLVICLIVKEKSFIYKEILISYIICFSLMLFLIIICLMANKKSTKEFVMDNNKIKFFDKEYETSQIRYCEYFVCKWYELPIAWFYKQERASLITFKFNSGEKIQFKLLYKDYLKIKDKIQNIILK